MAGRLTTLQFMLDDGSLNARQVEQVRRAVRERLTMPKDVLVPRVLALAENGTAAAAYVSLYNGWDEKRDEDDHRGWVDSVRRTARALLAGEAPRPTTRYGNGWPWLLGIAGRLRAVTSRGDVMESVRPRRPRTSSAIQGGEHVGSHGSTRA